MKNRSINFREVEFFDDKGTTLKLMDQVKEKLITFDYKEEDLKKALDKILNSLQDHYNKRKKDYSADAADNRAKEVFSQYCQNLVYYISHIINNQKKANHDTFIKNQEKARNALGVLLNNEFFFYKDTVWVDPKEEYTFLNALVRCNYADVLQAFLNKAKTSLSEERFKFILTKTNKDGFHPLNAASAAGHVAVVACLLEKAAAEFGGKDTKGFHDFITKENNVRSSPLNSASAAGHVGVMNCLLENAADAFEGKKTKGFRDFIRHRDKFGFSSLNAAVKEGHIDVVEGLLENAALAFGGKQTQRFCDFISKRNNNGFSPLNSACASTAAHEEIIKTVECLLKNAAQAFGGKKTDGFCDFISKVNDYGFSPLNSASTAGHLTIVECLFENADEAYGGKKTDGFRDFISKVNNDKYSPLNAASAACHEKVVECLLKNAAEAFGKHTEDFYRFIRHQDKFGFTPLNAAVKTGNINVVTMLLENAADAFGGKNTNGFCNFISEVNGDKFSPLNSASTAGHKDIVKCLLENAAIAFNGKKTEGFRDFISKVNKDEYSPLNAASYAGHKDVVKVLWENALEAWPDEKENADEKEKNNKAFFNFINKANVTGFSPLNAASYAGHVKVVQYLLENAADAFGGKNTEEFRRFISKINNYGFSPLNAASKEGHLEVVKLLLENAKEAFKETKNGFQDYLEYETKEGFTSLNSACLAKKLDVANYLFYEHGANPNIKNMKGFSALDNSQRHAESDARWKILKNNFENNRKNHSSGIFGIASKRKEPEGSKEKSQYKKNRYGF